MNITVHNLLRGLLLFQFTLFPDALGIVSNFAETTTRLPLLALLTDFYSFACSTSTGFSTFTPRKIWSFLTSYKTNFGTILPIDSTGHAIELHNSISPLKQTSYYCVQYSFSLLSYPGKIFHFLACLHHYRYIRGYELKIIIVTKKNILTKD